jgi:hypothetical protein
MRWIALLVLGAAPGGALAPDGVQPRWNLVRYFWSRPFQRSALGPGLEIRYYRVFGDPRFKSMVPVSLRWSF